MEDNSWWFENRKMEMENGKYVLYHGTRVPLENLNGVIRKGSLLEHSPEEAATWGDTNFFNKKNRKMRVFKIFVDPDQIVTGHWASLKNDYPISQTKIINVKKVDDQWRVIP